MIPSELIVEQRIIVCYMQWAVLHRDVSIRQSSVRSQRYKPRITSRVSSRTPDYIARQIPVAQRRKYANPPLSQMPQGLLLVSSVNDPGEFSQAQKKSVSLGCPGLSTGMLPAQFRGNGQVTLGSGFVTWKSAYTHTYVSLFSRANSEVHTTHNAARQG